jgi:membrane fusion protein (multidrug efflux system)
MHYVFKRRTVMNMRLAPTDLNKSALTKMEDEPRRRFRWALAAIAMVTLFLSAVAWWWWRGPPMVTAAYVKRGSAAEIVYATGAVEPETWSRSTPLVRGRIVERCRCEGKAVVKGEVLARLDDKELVANLNELQAQEEYQHREFDRKVQLLARGATTSQAHEKAESDLARIRAQIAAQTERLEYFKIVAPMTGIVLKEDGEVGDMVEPGTILYRIGLGKPLWVVAEVNQEDIPRIRIGQRALLRSDAFSSQVLPGVVKQLTPAGDPVAKTFRIRVSLPDDSPLQVGMSVEANIVSREKPDVLLAPANAIVNNGLLVIGNGRVRFRKVETGLRGANFVEVVEGASEGELVASPATTNIMDGSRIRASIVETAP